MPDLTKTQRERSKKLDTMRSIIKKADEEKRQLTESEINEFNGLDEEAKRLNDDIDRELRLLQHTGETRTIPKIPMENNDGSNRTGDQTGAPGEQRTQPVFSNIGEFFATIATNRNDERLRNFQYHSAPPMRAEARTTQIAGTGSLGGFNIPTQFSQEVLAVAPQEGVIRPGATVLPAGYPPDAEYEMPALDQGASQNMYGGVLVYRQGEAVSITETNTKFKKVTLLPKAIKAYIRVSNKLMNNWESASIFIQKQLKLAGIGAEDYDFYRGSGVNRSLGIINSTGRINYSRATANLIAYADVVGMFARAKLGGKLVWIASQTTIPQLATIRDAGSNNLWIQNSAEGIPSKMLGFDVKFSDRNPALGTAGDLTLVDRSYYLIKEGSGPRVDVSTDFLFDSDEVCFRIVWMVDGQPWLTEPIPLEGSTSNTVSPFVVLN